MTMATTETGSDTFGLWEEQALGGSSPSAPSLLSHCEAHRAQNSSIQLLPCPSVPTTIQNLLWEEGTWQLPWQRGFRANSEHSSQGEPWRLHEL